jgi:hypothetical protein
MIRVGICNVFNCLARVASCISVVGMGANKTARYLFRREAVSETLSRLRCRWCMGIAWAVEFGRGNREDEGGWRDNGVVEVIDYYADWPIRTTRIKIRCTA